MVDPPATQRHLRTKLPQSADCSELTLVGWAVQVHTEHMLAVCMCERAHHSPSSMRFMSSPNLFISGLPSTAMMTSQTVISDSQVDVVSKRAYRMLFCRVVPVSAMTLSRTPLGMIFSRLRSCTMSLGATSLMNRGWKNSRTCLAAQKRRVATHQTSTSIAHCRPPSTHFERDREDIHEMSTNPLIYTTMYAAAQRQSSCSLHMLVLEWHCVWTSSGPPQHVYCSSLCFSHGRPQTTNDFILRDWQCTLPVPVGNKMLM